jgi:hypothetical protein
LAHRIDRGLIHYFFVSSTLNPGRGYGCRLGHSDKFKSKVPIR